MRVLDPNTYRIIPNLLASEGSDITVHNFNRLFQAYNLQVALPGNQWRTIRPGPKFGMVNVVPYLYGQNGGGHIMASDWQDKRTCTPLPVMQEQKRGKFQL